MLFCVKAKTNSNFAVKSVKKNSRSIFVYLMNHLAKLLIKYKTLLIIKLYNNNSIALLDSCNELKPQGQGFENLSSNSF